MFFHFFSLFLDLFSFGVKNAPIKNASSEFSVTLIYPFFRGSGAWTPFFHCFWLNQHYSSSTLLIFGELFFQNWSGPINFGHFREFWHLFWWSWDPVFDQKRGHFDHFFSLFWRVILDKMPFILQFTFLDRFLTDFGQILDRFGQMWTKFWPLFWTIYLPF